MQAFAAPAQQGLLRPGVPRRLHTGRARPADRRRHGLRPAQRPRAGRVLVRPDALRRVRLRRSPRRGRSTRSSATRSRPSTPATSSAPSATRFVGPYVYYWGAQAPIFQVDGNDVLLRLRRRELAEDDRASSTTWSTNGTIVDQDSVFSAGLRQEVPGQGPRDARARSGTPAPSSRTRTASTRRPDRSARRAPLHWEGEDTVTGNVGGGTWYASQPLQEPRRGQDLPRVRHELRRVPGRARTRAIRPTRRRPTSGSRKQAVRRLLRRRLREERHRRRAVRSGTAGASRASAPRRRTGQDGHRRRSPRARRIGDLAAGLAEGDRERGAGAGLHGRKLTMLTPRKAQHIVTSTLPPAPLAGAGDAPAARRRTASRPDRSRSRDRLRLRLRLHPAAPRVRRPADALRRLPRLHPGRGVRRRRRTSSGSSPTTGSGPRSSTSALYLVVWLVSPARASWCCSR